MVATLALVAAVRVQPATAIDDIVHDDFRFALHGASALCHNLALSPSYAGKTRARLARAGKTLFAAADFAELGQYLPALAKAKKGASQAGAAASTDPVLRVQLYGTL